MTLHTEFAEIPLSDLVIVAQEKKDQGYRFAQMLCVNAEAGVDMIYSFIKGSKLLNYTVADVKTDDTVPSITDIFLEAFVFENEAHDLFGVDITGIAIDFGGNFYQVAEKAPMTIISPAQKAAKEKAAKVAAAKAAKEAKATKEAKAEPETRQTSPDKTNAKEGE